MNEHLSKQFDSELDALRAQVMRMGGLVEEQFRAALIAFDECDPELIETVIAGDEQVDKLEISIDEACTHILMRRQPIAIDLRMVMAVGKTVTDLERIGDEAKKIAKITRNIMEHGMSRCFMQIIEIRHMGDQVTSMLHQVLDAFVRHDIAAATEVIRRDREIDIHFRSVARHLITYMMEDPRTISTALDVIFIAKSVERIGDHCKNIAKDVIYIAEGRDIRHVRLDNLDSEVKTP
ncbi:MAG: phosphate signaling complex protein PhoU [Pseudomonadota bacterium]